MRSTPQQLGDGVARRRLLLGAAAAAAAPAVGGLTFAGTGAASEPARYNNFHSSIVKVFVTGDSLTITPNQVPAGVVTLEVSTDTETSRAPGLFALQDGVPISVFLQHYRLANSTDPNVKRKALELIDDEAYYVGGASVTLRGGTVRSTTLLTPGNYYIFNYGAVNTPGEADSVKMLTVGAPGPTFGKFPHVDANIAMYRTGLDSHFLAPAELPADGTIQVTNHTAQINEAMFLPMVPGATADDVHAFMEALRLHTPPPPAPWFAGPSGPAPIGTGVSNVVTMKFPPGRYVLTSFMSNRRSLIKNAFEGMWSIVDLV